jgi:hypothetical protein
MPAVRTGRRSILAATTRDPEAPATAIMTGSELVTIDRWQARAYEQAITAAYHPDNPPPLHGWNPTGEGGGSVGYDLVLATPRTLSAVGWCFFSTDRGVSDDIMRANHQAAQDVAVKFSVAIGSETPVMVSHLFDSAGQPWLHVHVVCGALARPERPGWSGPQRQDEVWLPLDPATVARMAQRADLRLPPAGGAAHPDADGPRAWSELEAARRGRLLRGVGPDGADAGVH